MVDSGKVMEDETLTFVVVIYFGFGVVRMVKLTPKQERFVDEYLVDLNAAAAARRAGYSEKTAEAIGYENLRKPQIMDAIQKRQGDLQDKLEITQERVIKELAKVAFANGTIYAQVAGGGVILTETAHLTENQKAAVSGIKEGKFGVEVSTYDKVKALELLGKHLGIFNSGAGGALVGTENNLLSAIMGVKEVDTDDLSEVQ